MTSPICIGCGCDERHACTVEYGGVSPAGMFTPHDNRMGCWWLRFDAGSRTGVCSCCSDLVRTWDAGGHGPILPAIADRFHRQVMFLYDDEASARAWLAAPQQQLGGRSPQEKILEGGLDEVRAIVDQLASGAFA